MATSSTSVMRKIYLQSSTPRAMTDYILCFGYKRKQCLLKTYQKAFLPVWQQYLFFKLHSAFIKVEISPFSGDVMERGCDEITLRKSQSYLKSHKHTRLLASDWSRQITWPEYWPLIGRDWSRDLVCWCVPHTANLFSNHDLITSWVALWFPDSSGNIVIIIQDRCLSDLPLIVKLLFIFKERRV